MHYHIVGFPLLNLILVTKKWLQGIKMKYNDDCQRMIAFLSSVEGMPGHMSASGLDPAPYSAGSQMMAAIGCIKGKIQLKVLGEDDKVIKHVYVHDIRELVPCRPSGPIWKDNVDEVMQYVIQYVEPSWPVLTIPPSERTKG